MESPLYIRTTVLPGKIIEVTSSSLVEGDQVDVTIRYASSRRVRRRTVMDIIEANHPPQVFKTADDVDEYLERERNSWDR